MSYPSNFTNLPAASTAPAVHTPALIESLDDKRAMPILAKVQRIAAQARADNEKSDARRAWEAAIVNSPEAAARPLAAARLIEMSRPATMTADQARATLRGLRPEASTTATTTAATAASAPPQAPDARAARLAELRMAGVAFRASRGDADAKNELRNIRAGRA